MEQASHIQIAGIAQKMLTILELNCPDNYNCGGPAYGAVAATETILHRMGIGTSMMLRRSTNPEYMLEFQKEIRRSAVTGNTILGEFSQHKSQILSTALYSLLFDVRRGTLRECDEVTEKALLTVLEWYFSKSGADRRAFWKKLQEGGHDELIQLEKGSVA